MLRNAKKKKRITYTRRTTLDSNDI